MVATGQMMWNIAVSANCSRESVTVSEKAVHHHLSRKK